MGGSASNQVALTIHGPIARADLPGLCERISALLAESRADLALCRVCDLEPDAVTVDALARLQLAAKRTGCRVRLYGGSKELCALLEFMGLADVLCVGTGPIHADEIPSSGAA